MKKIRLENSIGLSVRSSVESSVRLSVRSSVAWSVRRPVWLLIELVMK